MNLPKDLSYTKEHIWVSFEGDVATIGITDFAQSELGDIVYVDIEKMDEVVKADEVFGSIEAVKTVSDLFMPVEGEIFEFNEALEDDPELINTDPYKKGWIIKIKIQAQNKDTLLSVEKYEALING